MSKELEKLYTYNNELVAQRHKLIAEVKRLKKYDDTAEFNKGWKAAQAGEPLGDRMDAEEQGWKVFMFDGLQAEVDKFRWIPVGDEKKPDIGEFIWAYNPKFKPSTFTTVYTGDELDINYTHWMLATPPDQPKPEGC